jgi:hypothetical protein
MKHEKTTVFGNMEFFCYWEASHVY